MKKRVGIYIVALVAIISGCSNSKGGSFKPVASGTPYELLVVIDKSLWAREAGEALKEVLTSSVPCLPQHEPNFKLSVVNPAHFDDMLKPVRNIVIVDIDSQRYTLAKMSYSRDKWASGQFVLTIKAPSEIEMQRFVEVNRQSIIDFFVNAELNRAIKGIEKTHNSAAKKEIERMFGVSMLIPSELKISKEAENFFWISNDGTKTRTDIVVYSFPYSRKSDLGADRLIERRDSIMKANIPGGFPNSYMTTAQSIGVVCDTIGIRGKFCVTLAGLWEMKGDMMGGPFISHTILDEKNQRVITAEAFVFAPGEKKRNLIRRLQAALYTMKLNNEQKEALELPINVDSENDK